MAISARRCRKARINRVTKKLIWPPSASSFSQAVESQHQDSGGFYNRQNAGLRSLDLKNYFHVAVDSIH